MFFFISSQVAGYCPLCGYFCTTWLPNFHLHAYLLPSDNILVLLVFTCQNCARQKYKNFLSYTVILCVVALQFKSKSNSFQVLQRLSNLEI